MIRNTQFNTFDPRQTRITGGYSENVDPDFDHMFHADDLEFICDSDGKVWSEWPGFCKAGVWS